MDFPLIVTDPDSGASKPAISCAMVDLPDPDGPRSTLKVPDARDRLTPVSTWRPP